MVLGDVRCADRKAMMGTLLLSIRLKHNLWITQNVWIGHLHDDAI